MKNGRIVIQLRSHPLVHIPHIFEPDIQISLTPIMSSRGTVSAALTLKSVVAHTALPLHGKERLPVFFVTAVWYEMDQVQDRYRYNTSGHHTKSLVDSIFLFLFLLHMQ
jgi:hypothetical protein